MSKGKTGIFDTRNTAPNIWDKYKNQGFTPHFKKKGDKKRQVWEKDKPKISELAYYTPLVTIQVQAAEADLGFGGMHEAI